MNKTELVAAIAESAKLSKKDAESALKAFTEVVTSQLVKKEKVQLVGFGTFEVVERPAREGKNPRTKAGGRQPGSGSACPRPRASRRVPRRCCSA